MKVDIQNYFKFMFFVLSDLTKRAVAIALIILFIICFVYFFLFIITPNSTNKTKYIGITANAVIERYTNRLGESRDGDFKIIMNNHYSCRIHDPIFPIWIAKISSYPPRTINQDGFEIDINCLPYISIDINNPQNHAFLKSQLGRNPTSSNDLIPFKLSCLKEFISYNTNKTN
jgi:hypothetical protein